MKKQWLQLLLDNQLTKETTSKSIKKMIKDFETIELAKDETLTLLSAEQDATRKEALQEEFNDYETKLNELDEELVRKIQMYVKNKSTYDKIGSNLNGNKGKSTPAAGAASATPASGSPAASGEPAGEPGAAGNPTGEPGASEPGAAEPKPNAAAATPAAEPKPEKKTNGWKIAGVLLGAGFGGFLIYLGVKRNS